jgi:hypothetical protein
MLKFDREQILNKYWELANLNSELTKGNITGQLKALDSLCAELPEKSHPAQPLPAKEVYRSAWMSPSRPQVPNPNSGRDVNLQL